MRHCWILPIFVTYSLGYNNGPGMDMWPRLGQLIHKILPETLSWLKSLLAPCVIECWPSAPPAALLGGGCFSPPHGTLSGPMAGPSSSPLNHQRLFLVIFPLSSINSPDLDSNIIRPPTATPSCRLLLTHSSFLSFLGDFPPGFLTFSLKPYIHQS